MGLLKYLIITILIFWVIRLLFRLIFPVVLKNAFSNMQDKASGNQPRNKATKPEGSISIDYMPKNDKKGNSDKLGDFVDYEEVK